MHKKLKFSWDYLLYPGNWPLNHILLCQLNLFSSLTELTKGIYQIIQMSLLLLHLHHFIRSWKPSDHWVLPNRRIPPTLRLQPPLAVSFSFSLFSLFLSFSFSRSTITDHHQPPLQINYCHQKHHFNIQPSLACTINEDHHFQPKHHHLKPPSH